ncbi:LysR family transcriptional regulator [Trinickia caryophylli]|uniref:DNA-binding transcriptional regulator, LysR family n=1 Tax=Trinickia caryophylli TaxID=28094 RepID=A0A1X7CK62_TRICW|nr:LysR family transcriptional regulator [Trinickia caryophylli]PMS09121.1 LysR family transcriptional regulator [Trinickia caryophylli]TRX19996.1 LysR family transcriptional regulator [Trinickia caryophylli]WQE12663.1 LysR family transcriptional regulator [Trinickia caryophylli]SME98246.1 DNA-binding transcriptional regulator, LysR family [Trinickia caryophylli]GLU30365.1 LysR family transcriptional regulator [Trinickia caryophylli]
MDFRGIDLNLLVAFDALMNERNVTRAATQVGVSQPAMSAALSRLRKLVGDPLFLRSAEGLLPTPRARDLAEPIAQALRQIENTFLDAPAFAPQNASLKFNLGLSDYPAFVLLPSLLESLGRQAPGISIAVHAFTHRDHGVDLLDTGAIDAAIGVPPSYSEGRIRTRHILRDEFVTIVARDHPVAARRTMSLKTYLALDHVLASPEGDAHGLVDQVLAQQGQKRRLALTLPQLFAVPGVVARTSLVATVMKRVALGSPASRRLASFAPPVVLPEIVFDLMWHRRTESHPAQAWLRDFIATHAASLQS